LDTQVAALTVGLQTDSGASNSDKITNVSTLALGARETNAVVEYSTTGTGAWSTTVPTFVDGAVSVYARQTDVAGNVSTPTQLTFTLDTTAAAPTVALTTDSGTDRDKLTNNATLNVTGTETGATVQYSANGTTNWQATALTATQGANSAYVRQTDVAGNNSSATKFDFTFDSVAPSAPTLTTSFLGSTTTVTSLTPTFSGTAEASATIALAQGSTAIATVTADSSGAWSYRPSSALAGGDYTWSAKATDAAGNSSSVSNLTFKVDANIPAAPVLGLASESALNTNLAAAVAASPLLTGTVGAGAVVSVSALNGPTTPFDFTVTQTAGATTWSAATTAGAALFADGDYTLVLKATNPANTLSSTASTHVLAGTDAANTLTESGTTVNAALFGFDGNDVLTGSTGTDLLMGGNGNDLLSGGAGFDYLSGGAGNDTLVGGAGSDIILLGSDVGVRDDVRFTAISDSPTGAGDVIMDFQVGTDKIDLRSLLTGYTSVRAPLNAGSASPLISFANSAIDTSGTNPVVSTTIIYNGTALAETVKLDFAVGTGEVVAPIDYAKTTTPTRSYYASVIGAGDELTGVVGIAGTKATVNGGTNLGTVSFTLKVGATGFTIALESGASTFVGDQLTPALPGDIVVGTLPTRAGEIKLINDSASTLGAVADNELHYRVSHPTQTINVNGSTLNVAQIDIRYDTNAAVGTTTASETLSMLFVETTQSPLQLSFNDFYLV
jgi:Ca2+-binding RTX toxin-like protein